MFATCLFTCLSSKQYQYPLSKFHRKRYRVPPQKIRPKLTLRAHGKKDQRSTAKTSTHGLPTCSVCPSHVLSYALVTVPVYWPWHAHAKIKRGGHFGVLTGMWIFQHITMHRATNSGKPHVKIRLAFYFVERERNNNNNNNNNNSNNNNNN